MAMIGSSAMICADVYAPPYSYSTAPGPYRRYNQGHVYPGGNYYYGDSTYSPSTGGYFNQGGGFYPQSYSKPEGYYPNQTDGYQGYYRDIRRPPVYYNKSYSGYFLIFPKNQEEPSSEQQEEEQDSSQQESNQDSQQQAE